MGQNAVGIADVSYHRIEVHIELGGKAPDCFQVAIVFGLDSIENLEFKIFKYDNEGNLSKVNSYSIDFTTGDTVRCGQLYFKDYYKTANPLYTTDEVRTFQLGYSGLINSSKNNFFSLGDYTKDYEYRADGRPRSAMVKYNGGLVYKLTFVYN